MRSLLPVNSLRNAALLAADTALVAMIDVDLLLSHTLSSELANPGRASALRSATAERNVFVLPAFETLPQMPLEDGVQVAKQAVAGSKAELQRLLRSKQLITFAAQLYAKGHTCTRFRTWFASSMPYLTQLTTNCEPWFMMDRHLNPQYDVRFRGYGWNKVAQVAHVASLNFSLMVHPSAFIVHMPHASSKAMSAYMASDKARQAQKAREWDKLRQQQQQQQGQQQGRLQGQQQQGQQQGRLQRQQQQRRPQQLQDVQGSQSELGRAALLEQGVHASRHLQQQQQEQAGQAARRQAGKPQGKRRLPSAAAQAFHERVSALRQEVLADLAARRFVPVVDKQSLHCRAVLPWWRKPDA